MGLEKEFVERMLSIRTINSMILTPTLSSTLATVGEEEDLIPRKH